MKKSMFVLLATIALIFAFVATASATPVKKVFADGSYALSDSYASEVKPLATSSRLSGAVTSLATGSGGTSSYSGSRTVYVNTKYYSYLGSFLCSYTSRVYYEWKNGYVTRSYHLAPWYSTNAYFFYYQGTHFSVFANQTWNGKYPGQQYTWCQGHFTQEVFRYGVISHADPTHETWVRGNGTYSWRTNP
jgi:hypothetical protein